MKKKLYSLIVAIIGVLLIIIAIIVMNDNNNSKIEESKQNEPVIKSEEEALDILLEKIDGYAEREDLVFLEVNEDGNYVFSLGSNCRFIMYNDGVNFEQVCRKSGFDNN